MKNKIRNVCHVTMYNHEEKNALRLMKLCALLVSVSGFKSYPAPFFYMSMTVDYQFNKSNITNIGEKKKSKFTMCACVCVCVCTEPPFWLEAANLS